MSEFLQRLEAEIHNRRLIVRGQKVLVAVSGGVDSMSLLHCLNSLAPKNRWQISVAHFNHRLRGRSSDADEKLVRKTADGLGLQFCGGHADVQAFAERSKISLEMAARKLRHEFLARTARNRNILTVALAHHADDQVELFFLRLLRGTGGEGLAGMKWRSPSPADPKRVLVRPTLGYTKAELLDFAVSKKIAFREDASNSSPDFLRNRIRNELLPMLRKNYQPAVDKTVLRLMEIVGTEAEFVGQIASGDAGDFVHQSVAVQRRILQARLTAAGLSADFDLVESLRATPEKFVSINLGLSVARDAMGRIQWRTEEANQFDAAEITLKLTGGAGQVNFDGIKFDWKILPQRTGHLPRKVGLCEFFDADRIGRKIILRHWHAGDRFQPIGMQSPVKLQDLFTNAKIPREQRHDLIIASVAGGEIFWVEGLRISENFKLNPNTKRKLVWRWSKK